MCLSVVSNRHTADGYLQGKRQQLKKSGLRNVEMTGVPVKLEYNAWVVLFSYSYFVAGDTLDSLLFQWSELLQTS